MRVLLTHLQLLRGLLYVYFSPEVADNQALRQCLSYFFPVFAFSSPHNQALLGEIALISISDHWDRDSDEQAAVSVSQVATLLSEWTDPRNVVSDTTDEHLQQRLALDTLKELLEVEVKDDRKVLVQFLSKLYIPTSASMKDVWLMTKLVEELQNERPLADALSRNALVRFNTALHKQFKELKDVDATTLEYQETLDDVYRETGILQDEDATPVKKAPKTAPTPRAATKYQDRYTPGYKKMEKNPVKRKVSHSSVTGSVVAKSKTAAGRKKTYSSSESSEGEMSDGDSDSTADGRGNGKGKGSPISKPQLKKQRVPSTSTRKQPARSRSQSKVIDFSESGSGSEDSQTDSDEPAGSSEDEVASVL